MLCYALVYLLIRSVTSCETSKCNETTSVENHRLTEHVILEKHTKSMLECVEACINHPTCRSVSYKLMGLMCQLNKADVHIAPHRYTAAKGYVYSDNPWPKTKLKSCSKIQQVVPDAKSGYYQIDIKGRKKEVYCDMDYYGGGWTLVVSISSLDNKYLNREQVNCLLPNRCVGHVTSNIPTRKLSDEDIHEIATIQGTFRVDQMTGAYVVFFQITGGADRFDSECRGVGSYQCPRIIASHTYPYQWESNCKGTKIGFQVYNVNWDCHRVFDTHDNNECGYQWKTSKHSTNRLLYAYPCSSTGIFDGNQGLVFVK